MSITHSESDEPNSLHSSGDSKELTDDQSRGDYQVEGATDEFRSVISPVAIASNNWVTAEDVVHGIIHKVRPTSESEEKRREVVGYIQRLIGNCLGVEVLPYGSMPLRTYLPDGDIDLTAFGAANFEDMLVDDMRFILQREEKNMAAQFRIKDVQLIRAEVKLLKCIVENIVVDISFNQIGGLCTLCFLEQIDRLIGKNHLFKTSIILIKAWCYYESRVLGSHHGLISTYALETLVLYIFHLYHSKLDGPLAVLYKFLDYFSKFDWETYCVSLSGPIRLSSLPAIVVEMPEDSDKNLLLTSEFMTYCVDKFSVPSRGGDQISRGLQQKFLNIVDPLRENNNLGRSVSKGNFYRVRSAFTYGAKKLARILALPEKTIANELNKFFSNTMARHGSSLRPDIQDFNPSITCSGLISLPPAFEMLKFDNLYEDATRDSRSCTYSSPNILTKGIEVSSDSTNVEPDRDLVLTNRFRGDANELASSGGLRGLKISKASSESFSPKKQTDRVSPVGKFYCAPHQFFGNSKFQTDSSNDGNQDPDKMEAKCESQKENQLDEKHEVVAPSTPGDFRLNHEQVPLANGEVAGSLNTLTDLTGDYDSYFRHLQYGRWFYESGMQSPHIPSSPNALYLNKPWDGAHPPQFKRNGFSNQHPNGSHHGPAVYGMPPHMLMQGVPFGWEEGPKHPRGTGYFPHIPNMNQPPHPRPPVMPRPPFCNGRNMIFPGSHMEMGSQEPSQSQVSGEKNMPVGFLDGHQMFPPQGNEYPNSNGFIPQQEVIPDFGSFGHEPRAFMPESKQQVPVSSSPSTPSDKQKSQPDFVGQQDRNSVMNAYHLKDENDFPPL